MSRGKFNILVIGSGIGGLSCAASLALCNYKVLVLEENPFLGGSMGSFSDLKAGRWKWWPGIQWVCDYSNTSVDYRLLKTITGGRASFSSLDNECQIKYFPDLDYQFTLVNDKGNLIDTLKAEFPDESRKIDLYFRYLDILQKKSGMFSLPKRFPPAFARIMFILSKAFKLLPHMDKSVTEVVDHVLNIEDKRLRAIFLSFSHYFGIPLNETPFPFYAYAQNMQFNGMFYPDGGGEALVEALAQTVRQKGGELRTSAEVKKIIFKNGKAAGVEIEDGSSIFANKIVSSIGIKETLFKLVPNRSTPISLLKP